jgi:hypothetical protein
LPSTASWMAMCVMAVVGLAPCQCFSPAGIEITAPGVDLFDPSAFAQSPTPPRRSRLTSGRVDGCATRCAHPAQRSRLPGGPSWSVGIEQRINPHSAQAAHSQHLLPMLRYNFGPINHASGVPVARASSSSN